VVGTNIAWARKPIGFGSKGKQQRKNAAQNDVKLTFQVVIGEGERSYNEYDPGYIVSAPPAPRPSINITFGTLVTYAWAYGDFAGASPADTILVPGGAVGNDLLYDLTTNAAVPRLTNLPGETNPGADLLFLFSGSTTQQTTLTTRDYDGWYGPEEIGERIIQIVMALASVSVTPFAPTPSTTPVDLINHITVRPVFRQGGRVWIARADSDTVFTRLGSGYITRTPSTPQLLDTDFFRSSIAYPQAVAAGTHTVNGVVTPWYTPVLSTVSLDIAQPFDVGFSVCIRDVTQVPTISGSRKIRISRDGDVSFSMAFP